MKRVIKLILVMCITMSLGLISCSKDAIILDEDTKETAYLSISMLLPSDENQSRSSLSGKSTNATVAESTIKSIDVLIYTQYGTFKSHNRFESESFTDNGDGTYSIKEEIKSTVGDKIVLVGANLSKDVANSVKGKSFKDFNETVHTLDKITNIAQGLPMFSKKEITTTLLKDEVNTLTVDVERIVAKITVEKADPMNVEIQDGTLGQLQFAVTNYNTKQFLLPHINNIDPNWSLASDYKSDDYIRVETLDYVNVSESATALANLSCVYALENTSEGKRKKEITYGIVRAPFIPKSIYIFTNGTDDSAGYTQVDNAGATAKTFYMLVRAAEGTAYFYDRRVAESVAIKYGLSASNILTYTNGYCYWYLWLNKSASQGPARWDVIRNNFQRCKIQRITTIGASKEVIDNPIELEKTPEEESSIEVTINVLDWNTAIDDNYTLGD